MKEFSRILLSHAKPLASKLEQVLSKEIAIILNNPNDFVVDSQVNLEINKDVKVHQNVIAHPKFQFVTKAEKVGMMDEFKELKYL